MHEFLYKCVSQFISNAADPLLKDVFLFELDKFYHSQVIKIDSEIKNIFKDEGIPFTMNKYYYDDILNARKAEKEGGLQKAMDGFSFPYHHNITQDQVKNSMKQTLTSFANTVRLSDANYNEELALKDLQEKLKSYCKVARKRIVDIVLLQTIERHIIKSMDIYFEALIAVDDNVLSQLIEPPARQARRKELDEKIEILRKSLHEL
ncbi:hypothetical protein FBU30_006896 [Linnemannia zychae]|nr:hypothetical protein FBU30_006896 [Linnemannia zychae]